MPLTPSERSLISELVRTCRAIVRIYDRGDFDRLTTMGRFTFRVQVERAGERATELLNHWQEVPDGQQEDTPTGV